MLPLLRGQHTGARHAQAVRAEARVDDADQVSEFVARSAGFVTPVLPGPAGAKATTTTVAAPSGFAVPIPAPTAPTVPTTLPRPGAPITTSTTSTTIRPKPPTTTSTTSTTVPPTTTTTTPPKPTTTTTTVPPSTTTTTTTIPPPGHTHQDAGAASWYPAKEGECAHRTIAKGTPIQVTNTATGATIRCRVADAGPSDSRRIIDLAKDTFAKIGDTSRGIIQVRLDW